MSATRIGKYACLEVERRYLLRALPSDLANRPPDRRITDHYFPDTRLRLRRVEYIDGTPAAYKLTQKFRAPDQSSLETTITNMVLTPTEYDRLRTLGGRELTKDRYLHRHAGLLYGVDVFHGPLAGLVLAETECPTTADALALLAPPFPATDVTDNPAFTGGSLVALAPDKLRQLLTTTLARNESP